MSDIDNFTALKRLSEEHTLSHEELVSFTEYSSDSVRAWFCKPGTERHRPVPDRALSLLRANLREKKGVCA